MRKIILTILLLHPLIIVAKDNAVSHDKCWQMTVEKSQNEVTFCINEKHFSSKTFHPNIKVQDPPTTCAQSGKVVGNMERGSTEIILSEGTCTNGMVSPRVHLECKIENKNLLCLYGKEYKLLLKPTHNKALNSDAAKSAAPVS